MKKNEIEICEFEVHLKNSCVCLRSNLVMITSFLPNQAQPVPGSEIVGSAELIKRKHEHKMGGNWESPLLSESLDQATLDQV